MADFKLTQRHPSIYRITDDATTAHNITNNTNATILVGAIVEVNRGKGVIQHFDVEEGFTTLLPGASASIDYSGVAGCVGVGFSDSKANLNSTADFIISSDVTVPLRKAKK